MRWYHNATRIKDLARDNAIALATAYRYVHEGIDVLAAQAPDLHQLIAEATKAGLSHLMLDGTLIATDRVNEKGLLPRHRVGAGCYGRRRCGC